MKEVHGLTADEKRAAEIFRALGNPARVRIVTELAKRGCTTGALVELLPLAQSTVSQHLRVLKDAGIIRFEDDEECYCLDPEAVHWLVRFCLGVCCPSEQSLHTDLPLFDAPPARPGRPDR